MNSILENLLDTVSVISLARNEGGEVILTVVPSSEDCEIACVKGNCVNEAIRELITSSPNYLSEEDREEFLHPAEPEDGQPLTLDNPYFFAFKKDLNREISKSIMVVEDGVDVNISAKISVTIDSDNAPRFANEAKLLMPLNYSVSTTAKQTIGSTKGKIDGFLARMENGQMILLNPDRQIALDEIIAEAEEDQEDEEEPEDED